MMNLETHGPDEEKLELLHDLFLAIDPSVKVTIDRGNTETWINIRAENSRSISKFIGRRGKVFAALRTVATVLSGVSKHRYMLRVFEAGE